MIIDYNQLMRFDSPIFNRLDITAALAAVIVHVFLLASLWQTHKPKLDFGTEELSFVDLSAFSSAAPSAENKPLPIKTAVPIQPKTALAKQPIKQSIIKPVIQQNAQDDLTQPIQKQFDKPVSKPQSDMQEDTQAVNQAMPAADAAKINVPSSNNSNDEMAGSQKQTDGGTGGGKVTPATHLGGHLGNLPPNYPPDSRDNGEEGSVVLRVAVSAEGRADHVAIKKSSGFPRLDRAARHAVKRYRFQPATRGGVAIPYVYVFAVHFNLSNG